MFIPPSLTTIGPAHLFGVVLPLGRSNELDLIIHDLQAIPMQVRHIFFLMVVFILYVIFGGIIFMLLESPQEQIKRAEVQAILVDLKGKQIYDFV